MKAVFVETRNFTEWVSEYLPDDAYADLQQELMDNPQKGGAMTGCGGLRKVRSADPRRAKGKRGGIRVIYLFVPEAKWFFMLDAYGKGEKEDLSADEKKALKALSAEFKKQAIAATRRASSKETQWHRKM